MSETLHERIRRLLKNPEPETVLMRRRDDGDGRVMVVRYKWAVRTMGVADVIETDDVTEADLDRWR